MYTSLTPNDRIITGDSGAGYVNPTQLLEPRLISNLPSGEKVWQQHCEDFYAKFSMQFTGFLINGAAGPLTNASESMYSAFAPFGGIEQQGYAPVGDINVGAHLTEEGIPMFQEMDIDGNATKAAEAIVKREYPAGGVSFRAYRSVLCSPTYHVEVVDLLLKNSSDFVVLDPLKLSVLAKFHLGVEQVVH